MSERESLKPCPFCGGEAKAQEGFPYERSPGVECASCPAEITQASLSDAITAWNTRARPEPSEAVVEAVARAYLKAVFPDVPVVWWENMSDDDRTREVTAIRAAIAAYEAERSTP